MKISARNVMKGNVVEIERGTVNAVVKVDLGGNVISSMITLDAMNDLALSEGSEVSVVIKASNVMLAVD